MAQYRYSTCKVLSLSRQPIIISLSTTSYLTRTVVTLILSHMLYIYGYLPMKTSKSILEIRAEGLLCIQCLHSYHGSVNSYACMHATTGFIIPWVFIRAKRRSHRTRHFICMLDSVVISAAHNLLHCRPEQNRLSTESVMSRSEISVLELTCSYCAVYEPLISHKGGYASTIPLDTRLFN